MRIWLLLASYMAFAILRIIARVIMEYFRQDLGPVWCDRPDKGFGCLMLPAVLLLLPIILPWLFARVSYQWLYPDRCFWSFREKLGRDLTEEEQQAVDTYREALSRKSLFRRLGENLHLIKRENPPWPLPVDHE